MGVERGEDENADHHADINQVIHKFGAHEALFTYRTMALERPAR
jgi:hypothetical protein